MRYTVGGRAFRVDVDGLVVRIWKESAQVPKHVMDIVAERVFVGDAEAKGILVQMSPTRYIFIGSEMYRFETLASDTIHTFDGRAIGSTHLYNLVDRVAVELHGESKTTPLKNIKMIQNRLN